MNNGMKRIVGMAVLASACVTTAYGQPAQNGSIAVVRQQLDAVMQNLPCDCGDVHMLYNMPTCFTQLQSYPILVAGVSNNLSAVMDHFGICATNRSEKLVLMSVGWAYDDDYYLRFMDGLSAVAVSGGVTADDYRWYCSAHRNELRLNILALRYQEPIVSNILNRVEMFTGDTNRCNRIRSGEARSSYLNWRENAYGPLLQE